MTKARRRDRLIGLAIVCLAFLVGIIISYWARETSRPELSEPPPRPTVEGVVGWQTSVDPVATLSAARRLTKRPLLRGFSASAVGSDGTVDFRKSSAKIRYSFQSSPGQGPQPPRAPGTVPSRRYCGRQNVHVQSEGLVVEEDRANVPCTTQVDALPDPRCTVQDIWRHAIQRGAPQDQDAQIEYYRSTAGPAWRFEIPGTRHRYSVYGDCTRTLQGSEAIGSVP